MTKGKSIFLNELIYKTKLKIEGNYLCRQTARYPPILNLNFKKLLSKTYILSLFCLLHLIHEREKRTNSNNLKYTISEANYRFKHVWGNTEETFQINGKFKDLYKKIHIYKNYLQGE